MRAWAEILRWTLITLQICLVWRMARTGLWRKLPFWLAWLVVEIASRGVFDPGGNYWHLVWLPVQPMALSLRIAAVAEARWQVMARVPFAWITLAVVPVGMVLSLPETIRFRAGINLACALTAFTVHGRGIPIWHARLMGVVCLAGGVVSLVKADADLWWALRAGFLAVYVMSCLAWLAMLNLRDGCRGGSRPEGMIPDR